MTQIRRPARVTEAGPGPYAAGCTALQLAWDTDGPAALTDITGLAAARGVSLVGGALRIGALETLEQCRTHPLIRAHAPLLAEACGVIGALGVRLLATLGGNIGWRQGDTVPALLALDASVETADGVEKLDDVLGRAAVPLLLAVHVPPQQGAAVFEKIGHRAAFSLSAVTVAGCVTGGGARLAAGGAGHAARRLHDAEACFGGDPDGFAAAVIRAVDWGPGAIAARVLAGRFAAALAA